MKRSNHSLIKSNLRNSFDSIKADNAIQTPRIKILSR